MKNPEAPEKLSKDDSLLENWPLEGRVEFKNYSTRYRQGLELVIKNIDFEVQPAEKVGIVGPKANLNAVDADTILPMQEKERIVDLENVEVEEDGRSIYIDGVDILMVGLSRLRQNLTIILDPTLFAGTASQNGDNFSTVMDSDKILVLEKGHVEEFELPKSLLQTKDSLFHNLAQHAREVKEEDE
ncbi:hypothetical protein BGZ83_010246 [Gryganskiella cystojenkinii]|nr:hypothetical protein BGZ83_010246 [Gryganskiella cystojenkinii]